MANGRCRSIGRATALGTALALVTAIGAIPSTPASAGPATARTVSLRGGAGALSPRLQTLARASSATTRSRATLNEVVGLPARGPGSLLRQGDGRLLVDVWAGTASALAAAAALPSTSIVARGAGLTATLAVPLGELRALGGVPGLRSAREIPEPSVAPVAPAGPAATTHTATCPTGVVSEGDTQLHAALARTHGGVDGTGIKVGIISDSFGAFASEVSTDVAAGELPGTSNPCGFTTPVKVLSDYHASDATDEGRAMAQIVHDLAPGAHLLFASGFNGDIDFADQILALRDAGATVIVDDLGYFNEPSYQDGPIAAAVDQVTADGVAYFSAAGNDQFTLGGKSVGSYEAPHLRPVTCPSAMGTGYTGCHDFDPTSGVDTSDLLTMPAGGSVTVVLAWDEPLYGVTTDLDVALIDQATGQVLTGAADDDKADGQTTEIAQYANEGNATQHVKVVVGRFGSGGTPRFKLLFLQADLAAVQWNTSTGGDVVGPTLYGHEATLAGSTVAATPASDAGQIESFSSRGPATYCWAPVSGTTPSAPLGSCQTKQVDFSATDGVTTEAAGFEQFFGTSAAAPHAAAIAALLQQKQPCTSPTAIRTLLADTATSIAGYGPEAEGAGLLNADAAMTALPACGATPGAPGAPTVTSAHAGSVTLSWTAPTSSGTGPVTGYTVRVLDGAGNQVSTQDFGTATTETISSLAGGAYRFEVRAVADATGAYSPRSALTIPPFAVLDHFTTQQFQDFAGRAPTASESTSWRQLLLDSATTPSARIIRASQFTAWGPKLDPLTRLYQAFFLRLPDTAGLGHWLSQMQAGSSLATVAGAFAHSSEFTAHYGSLSNHAFVELIYQNVLGRAGDATGVAYWTGQLDHHLKSRGSVMIGFSESTEYKNHQAGTVNAVDLFFGMLRRVPTSSEVATWGPASVSSKASLANYLLTTAEYDARTT